MTTTNPLNAALPPDSTAFGPTPPAVDPDPYQIETVIQSRPGWIAVNWVELIHSHELFFTLVQRDIMVRYKQSVLGVAWAVIQPLFQVIVFTLIFGKLAGIKIPIDVPFSLYCYIGLVPWTFFANSVNGSALSLLNNQNLLTKIYFPRLYVPAAVIGGFLVDMAIGLGLLVIMMPIYRVWPSWQLVFLPVVILFTFVATLGIGLVLAAMTLLYRDIRFVIPFMLQLMPFVSGVVVPLDNLRWEYRSLAALNPMYGVVGAFRSCILGAPWDFGTTTISILSAAGCLAFGLFFFRKTERLIADIV